MRWPSLISTCLGWLVSLSCSINPKGGAYPKDAEATSITAITNVRVFDGRERLDDVTVLVQGDRVSAVGKNVSVPKGATVVEGRGKTLLPGLIDSHAHVWAAEQLQQAAFFGVTTVLDMGCGDPRVAATLKTQLAQDNSTLADLRYAGWAVTAPGGHGTEYVAGAPTLSQPDKAQSFVAERVAEGADYIKIIYDDLSATGARVPSIDGTTMRGVIDAAHSQGRMAVVHVGALARARDAVESGADGLAHSVLDQQPEPGFGELVASRGAFVIPTLSIERSLVADSAGTELASDPMFASDLSQGSLANLKASFPASNTGFRYENAEALVRQLRAAGVSLLAGTDSPNPGTDFGVSVHGELALLVGAGLAPMEALATATSVPAARFHLADRGEVAAGKQADLLLVDGDPTTQITDSRRIVAVFRRGVPLDRDSYRRRLATEQDGGVAAAQGGARLVSDFENGRIDARLGAGWSKNTDSYNGGTSTAEMKWVSGGVNGSAGALEISGTVVEGAPWPWAGATFSPGTTTMAPADLSMQTGFSFATRGDGKSYNVFLYSSDRGYMPVTRTFTTSSEWSVVRFRFSELDGSTGRGITGIAFAAGPAPGGFWFQIDDLKLE